MSKSPNLGLTLTAASEKTKRFADFRTELAGDAETSNMMIIDRELGKVIDRCEEYDTTPITWGNLKNGLGRTETPDEQEG